MAGFVVDIHHQNACSRCQQDGSCARLSRAGETLRAWRARRRQTPGSVPARTAAGYASARPLGGLSYEGVGGGDPFGGAALAAPQRLEVVTPEVVADSRPVLGRALAESRRSARVTQDRLALLVRRSRSSITNVEVGRQVAPREFWMACDVALGREGALLAAWGHTDARARRLREQEKEAQIRRLLAQPSLGCVCRELHQLLAAAGWRRDAPATHADSADLAVSWLRPSVAVWGRELALFSEYERNRVSLFVYLAGALGDAADDLAKLRADVPSADELFVPSWGGRSCGGERGVRPS
ncbi:helix-turn-helix domain-containing protein [Micromonospora coxensis]